MSFWKKDQGQIYHILGKYSPLYIPLYVHKEPCIFLREAAKKFFFNGRSLALGWGGSKGPAIKLEGGGLGS